MRIGLVKINLVMLNAAVLKVTMAVIAPYRRPRDRSSADVAEFGNKWDSECKIIRNPV